MLKIENMNISYNNRVLFDDASIIINSKRLTAISGQSGSGKTTLLYILGLISSFKDYSYCINGEFIDVSNQGIKANLRKSQIGFIFQDKNLHDYLSIEDNIKLYCLLSGVDYSEDKTLKIMEKVRLFLPLETKTMSLSGGEKQRLAIACALMKDPILIIADEPTSALDRNNTDIIISLLKEIALEGKMVIIASHSAHVLEQCDDIYCIKDCKLVCDHFVYEDDLKREINNRTMKSSFYHWYMKFQFGKGFIEKLITVLLPVMVVVICLGSLSLKDGLVHSYKSLLNDYVSNEVLVESRLEIDDKKFNWLKSLNGVNKGYYTFEISDNSVIIDGKKRVLNEFFYLVPYYEYQKEFFQCNKEYEGDVYLSYDMYHLLKLKNDSSLLVQNDVLINKEINLGGIFERDYYLTQSNKRNVIYIPYDYFIDIQSSQMIMHLDSFDVFDGIKERIHKIDSQLNVTLSQDKYLIQIQQINNYNEMIYLFIIVLIIMSVVILAVGQMYAIHNQKYELAVLKANGLKNNEICKMMFYQCGSDILKMVVSVYSLLIVGKIICHMLNIGFSLFIIEHLIVLIIMIIFDYILPTLLSTLYICYFDPEKILRF